MEEKKKKKKSAMFLPAPVSGVNTSVAKRNEIIQQARYLLTPLENNIVDYSLTKVKPHDTPDTAYVFDFKEFSRMTGSKSESYTYLKRVLQSLSNKSMWMPMADGKETLVRWFNTIDIDKGKSQVTITFHERIAPYVFGLENSYHTITDFRLTAKMTGGHSRRIYEILKSYSNNKQWSFEIGTGSNHDLYLLLNNYDEKARKFVIPARWQNFNNFKTGVLEPSKEEINKLTDLIIDYKESHFDFSGKKHRKVASITFFIEKKTLLETKMLLAEYDDEYKTEQEEEYEQISLFGEQFFDEQEQRQEDDRELRIQRSRHPLLTRMFSHEFDDMEIMELFVCAKMETRRTNLKILNEEQWAAEYIEHYYDKLNADRKIPRAERFDRLLDMVKNDKDRIAEIPNMYAVADIDEG